MTKPVLRHASSELPRSRGLAELLGAPSPAPSRLDPSLRRVLASRIAARAPGRHLGALRLDSYRLLESTSALADRDAVFSWSPRTARRLIGLAAARLVVRGGAPNPLTAVLSELEGAIERASRARTRPGALGAWLAEAPAGLQAAVIAEATGYATDVVTLLDASWDLETIEVGRPDPVWAAPGAPWISLKARRDLEVSLDPVTKTRALVALRTGRPSSRAVDDLGFVALADALNRPAEPMATRVVGVWPGCGRSVSLEVDAETMRRAARLVVGAIETRASAGRTAAAA